MLDDLIAEHGRRLFSLCLKLCSQREDAEDLYQETWCKVCASIDKYNKDKPFEHWLTAVCVNTYRDNLRKRRWTRLMAGFSGEEEKQRAIESVADVAENEQDREVREAVAQLPEKLRVAVVLHYFLDRNIEETAQQLGIPPGTLKSRLYKARRILEGRLCND